MKLNASTHYNLTQKRKKKKTHNQQDILRSHNGIMTALVCIDSPFRGRIVNRDRSGIIKMGRVRPCE